MNSEQKPQPGDFMALALEEAKDAAGRGEVPVGAAVVDAETGQVICTFANAVEALNDPTAHAEIMAIRTAAAMMKTTRLNGYDLYVTLEPCPMCAGAIAHARLRRLYFGAYDPKGGGVEHGPRVFEQPTCHHKPEVIGGLMETEAGELLKAFFQQKR